MALVAGTCPECRQRLAAHTVRVERSLTELPGGGFHYGPPKTDAGLRVVPYPELIAAGLSLHLARYTATDVDALVFTSPTGQPLRHGNSGAVSG